jgi:hypothetical protein
MAVCISFNYPRKPPLKAGVSGTINCGVYTGTKLSVENIPTPLPFQSMHVLSFPNGFTTTTGRNTDSESQVDAVTPAGWPHIARAVFVPGVAGDTTCGAYILFGQTKP